MSSSPSPAARGGHVPERPELKPWYRVANADGRAVLEYGERAVVLEGRAAGRLLPVLLPLLDGRRTVPEIVSALGTAAAPAVEHALSVLAEHDLLSEGPPLDSEIPADAAATALFLAASSGAATAAALRTRLDASLVAVAGSSPFADDVARLLHRGGVGHVARVALGDPLPTDAESALLVALPARDETAALESVNTRALEVGVPWLQVLPFNGRLVTIGPLFVPGTSCCHRCFLLRRHSSLTLGADFWALEEVPGATPLPPFVAAASTGLAATLALRWCAYADRTLPGRFLAFEPRRAIRLSEHRVLRVPRCPACSGLDDVAPPLPWFKVAG